MAVKKPTRMTMRCYGVGFGDCFLLTFHYSGNAQDRHVLIDFGSTQRPPNGKKGLMQLIAKDIAAVVGERLHVLVATHRHADHINGFATNKSGTDTGDIIAKLKPGLVVQPWTERPDAPRDFKGSTKSMRAANDALRVTLARMTEQIPSIRSEAARHLPAASEIDFIAEDGVKNLSAVKNLAKMGKATKALYASYGSSAAAFRSLLPGVKVTILGPPTISQKADVLNQNPQNKDEYWHFARYWAHRAQRTRLRPAGLPFARAKSFRTLSQMSVEARWFVRRLRIERSDQLLRIVRSMDDALNNTSLILLFQAGKKKFLFPGDAQWENWELALKKKAVLLRDVDVYKVGHHGSLNATPRTLWDAFSRRSDSVGSSGRLVTVMSTRSDSKHGHTEKNSEVPRRTLVTALKQQSVHRSTQELEPTGELVLTLQFDL